MAEIHRASPLRRPAVQQTHDQPTAPAETARTRARPASLLGLKNRECTVEGHRPPRLQLLEEIGEVWHELDQDIVKDQAADERQAEQVAAQNKLNAVAEQRNKDLARHAQSIRSEKR